MIYPQFHILGTQRSGTTLLRLILNAHSKIAIPEEGRSLIPLIKNDKQLSTGKKASYYNYLTSDHQFSKWKLPDELISDSINKSQTTYQLISNLYKNYGRFYGKNIVGDKSLFFLELNKLLKFNGNAKFIYIVRDGRDSYLSLIKKNHHSAYSYIIGGLEWFVKNRIIINFLKQINKNNYIIIKYEDLLDDPEKIIEQVCTFLDVEFEKEMLCYWETSSNFIDNKHSRKIFQPIDSSNYGKWKKELSEKDLFFFQFFSKKLLKKYNYEVVSIPFSYHRFVQIIIELIKYIPQRIFHIVFVRIIQKRALLRGESTSGKIYE